MIYGYPLAPQFRRHCRQYNVRILLTMTDKFLSKITWLQLLNVSKWAEFWTEKQLYVVLFRSWFYFHNNLVIIIGYMVFPFLQEKYPKYIHNIFVLFFLQKILQKRFFLFLFSVKTNFQKMPHTTSRTLHTSRKSPVSCISSSLSSVTLF